MEEMQAATALFGAGKTIFQGLDFIRGIADSNIISAYFDWDGSRIEGSEKIVVVKQAEGSEDGEEALENDGIWWFYVEEAQEYAFVRIPLVESGIDELLASLAGETNPDARFWRWVARPRTGVLVGGQNDLPNVKVPFIVIGYKPKALLDYFKS